MTKMLSYPTPYQRQKKTQEEVRACASEILKAVHKHDVPDLKKFRPSIQQSAYRLLKYEGLINTFREFKVTTKGAKHIHQNGYVLYPRK